MSVKISVDDALARAVRDGDLEAIESCIQGGADVFKEVRGIHGYKDGETIWDILHADQKLGDKSSAVIALTLVKAYSEWNHINESPDKVLKDIHAELLKRRKMKKIEATKDSYRKGKGKPQRKSEKKSRRNQDPARAMRTCQKMQRDSRNQPR